MSNLLSAVKLIISNPITNIGSYYTTTGKNAVRNRANSVGDALEFYVRNVFANCLNAKNEAERMSCYDKVFSYRGNQNNPPDLVLKGGDAIETKKIQSAFSALALNSSYPKAKLFADNPMLTDDCRTCEDWKIKDIIYAVGHTPDSTLKYLWLVYGDCFAANKKVYEKIKQTISDGVNSIPNVEFSPSNELGRVNRVDPLGITNLRIRGMWHIDNPHRVFNYLDCTDDEAKFQVIVLLKAEKFETFPEADKRYLLNLKKDNYIIRNVKIKNPDNPAKLLDCKLITYRIY
jgi:hypothetical protein